mmetsp:Transcript_120546/g.239986  ORF Transcript_120546/g.239986 Transcript_120546/m.239986 type:complete len:248 (-) Transcript_120546:835-1578(-)
MDSVACRKFSRVQLPASAIFAFVFENLAVNGARSKGNSDDPEAVTLSITLSTLLKLVLPTLSTPATVAPPTFRAATPTESDLEAQCTPAAAPTTLAATPAVTARGPSTKKPPAAPRAAHAANGFQSSDSTECPVDEDACCSEFSGRGKGMSSCTTQMCSSTGILGGCPVVLSVSRYRTLFKMLLRCFTNLMLSLELVLGVMAMAAASLPAHSAQLCIARRHLPARSKAIASCSCTKALITSSMRLSP